MTDTLPPLPCPFCGVALVPNNNQEDMYVKRYGTAGHAIPADTPQDARDALAANPHVLDIIPAGATITKISLHSDGGMTVDSEIADESVAQPAQAEPVAQEAQQWKSFARHCQRVVGALKSKMTAEQVVDFLGEQIDAGIERLSSTDTSDIDPEMLEFVRKMLDEPASPPTAAAPAEPRIFNPGDRVRKIKGASWQGTIVGAYSTALTPEGYAVESERELGSVQIYPAAALELAPAEPDAKDARQPLSEERIREIENAHQPWDGEHFTLKVIEFARAIERAHGIGAKDAP